MIRLRGQLRCLSDADVAVVQAQVGEHTRLSREEPGCLSFEVVQSEDPMVWEVMESFRDRESFATHQTRTRASPWWDATCHILRDFRVEELGD